MPNLPKLPALVPQRGGKISQFLFKYLYFAQGWRFEGEFPNLPKAVAIVLPHTSNADGWYGFNFVVAMDFKIHIFAKDSLFRTPLKPLLQWLNVIGENEILHKVLHNKLLIFSFNMNVFGLV